MRSLLPSLALSAVVAVALAPSAHASTGGADAPTADPAPPSASGGGAAYRRKRRVRGPVLTSFRLRRPRLFLYGRPAQVTFRIRSATRLADVRIVLVPASAGPAASVLRLGRVRAGAVPLTGRENGTLPEGSYHVRVRARDARGRRLRRRAGVSSSAELSFFHHRFPLGGPFGYGSADARFGAPRDGHEHQGQDLTAPEGTPVLAPRGGVVKAVQYQAAGAGHYVVIDGAEESRDYVFMHLRTGSIPVVEGQTVRTGQRIGEVGDSGRSSGPHLHFEIWTGGGWFTGGKPVDPLPLLRTWQLFG